MRYGLLADVHGNLPALEAALAALRARGAGRFVVAGDLVGYGPQPDECVEVVAGLGATCVAGNHDLIALGRLSDARCIPLARDSLRWTRRVLGADARAFLEGLPATAVAEGLLVAHGALDDPEEYTVRASQAEEQLAEAARRAPEARALVLGHTHRAWCFSAGHGTLGTEGAVALPATGPVLVNPGAVGQSRDLRARARAAILDLHAGTVELLALRYDLAACRAALRRAGLSRRSCHLRPTPWRAAGRAARRALDEHRAAASGARTR